MRLTQLTTTLCLLAAFTGNLLLAEERRPDTPEPPGTVIARSPDWKKVFLGTPSLEVMPDGTYIFSHDWFNAPPTTTSIYESKDKGITWTQIGEFHNQNSGTLFRIENTLYHIGWYSPVEKDGRRDWIAIRKSTDGGRTWTEPNDASTGRILTDSAYYSDPVPVLLYNGRVWWQVDVQPHACNASTDDFGSFGTMVISAPLDSNLLDAASWTRSNIVLPESANENWKWLEGNVLADPDGNLVVYMRTDNPKERWTEASRLHLSPDGKTLTFDPAHDFIPFTSKKSKFTIRFDEVSGKYWSLTSNSPTNGRNRLLLVCSKNLVDWEVRAVIHQHEDPSIGFQYAEWRVEGDDLIYVLRLGWYGANFHDSNYMTFDRIKDFRNRVDP